MNAQFLPEDYIAPRSGGGYYTKLNNGVNRIRILSAPVMGWQEWIDNKPVRYRMDEKPVKWHNKTRKGDHFWSFIIWNYQEKMIQVLQITQVSIRKVIESLSKDSTWGSPFFYDITITREGEGKKTTYTIHPLPRKTLDPYIQEAFEENRCNLDALFDSNDPFGLWDSYTDGVFTQEEANCTETSDRSKFISKIKPSDDLGQKCNQSEMDDFMSMWSQSYDKKLLETYIAKRSEHFEVDPRETVFLLMNDQNEFEKEFKNWSKKYVI